MPCVWSILPQWGSCVGDEAIPPGGLQHGKITAMSGQLQFQLLAGIAVEACECCVGTFFNAWQNTCTVNLLVRGTSLEVAARDTDFNKT